MVWRRRNLLSASLIVSALLGGVYYSHAPRQYAAYAEPLLLPQANTCEAAPPRGFRELEQERRELRQQLEAHEAELLTLTHDLEARSGGSELGRRNLLERVAGFHRSLMDAQKNRRKAEAYLAACQRDASDDKDIPSFTIDANPSVDEANSDPENDHSQARQRLIEYRAALSQLLLHYGPAHSRVREVQEQIQLTELSLQNRTAEFMKSPQPAADQVLTAELILARQNLWEAQVHEQTLRAEFERERAAALEVSDQLSRREILSHDVDRLRWRDLFLVEQMKVTPSESKESPTAITSKPAVEPNPISPNPLHVAAVSQLVGILLGFGLVILAEARDDRFRSPEDLRQQLKVSLLASVGQLPATGGKGFDALNAWANPDAPETAAFRMMVAALQDSLNDTQRLMLTSPESLDGKTLIAANLAVAIAHAGQKTLLIDADLHQSGLTALLGLTGPRGLSAILRDHEAIAESATRNVICMPQPGLDVLPSGPGPGGNSNLFAEDRFSELLAWAATHYDRILLDAPSLRESDPLSIGGLVDGVLLIVNLEKNRRKQVRRAVEILQSANCMLRGLVTNQPRSKAKHTAAESINKRDAWREELTESSNPDDWDEPSAAVAELITPKALDPMGLTPSA